MAVEEVLEEIIQHAQRDLSVAGFKRSKQYFFRQLGEATHRVAFSFRKVRGEEGGWLAVTVCVGFKSLADFLHDFPELNIERKRPCMMATDLGHLVPPYNYHEWRLASQPNAAVSDEILDVLNAHGLRYFETYGELRKAVAAWEAGTTFNAGYFAQLYACTYYYQRGEREKAVTAAKKIIAECDAEFRTTGQRAALNQKRIFEDFLAFSEAKVSE
jgi:hypothetical protein